MDYLERIESVKKEIQKYYGMSFDQEKDDYNDNKTIKNKLKRIIIESKENHENKAKKALLVLVKSTGCFEHQEIADEIIDDLQNSEYISDSELDYFYENIATGRWM